MPAEESSHRGVKDTSRETKDTGQPKHSEGDEKKQRKEKNKKKKKKKKPEKKKNAIIAPSQPAASAERPTEPSLVEDLAAPFDPLSVTASEHPFEVGAPSSSLGRQHRVLKGPPEPGRGVC